jgi:hypothetical protein
VLRALLICLAIAGCARAGKENTIVGGIIDGGDGGEIPGPDGRLVDAPPGQVTLSQTASLAITLNNSLACVLGNAVTVENSYYRVFPLTDFGVTAGLHVIQVEFAIQQATAGQMAATQPGTVRVGTYSGAPGGSTIDPAQLQMIASVEIRIANGNGTRMTVPIEADIPALSNVYAELAIPNSSPEGNNQGNKFFVGTNTDTETAPGYTFGPECGVTPPRSMQSVAEENSSPGSNRRVRLVMSVTGMKDGFPK